MNLCLKGPKLKKIQIYRNQKYICKTNKNHDKNKNRKEKKMKGKRERSLCGVDCEIRTRHH